MHQLATLFEKGVEGLHKDQQEAFQWYKKASGEANHTPSFLRYAILQRELGKVEDEAAALLMLLRAADDGDEACLSELLARDAATVERIFKEQKKIVDYAFVLLVNGKKGEALQLLEKFGESGRDIGATIALGEIYFQGTHGIPRNLVKAIQLLQIAYESSDPIAREKEANIAYLLGCAFIDAENSEQRPDLAAMYFQVAADKGFSSAMYSLAMMYYEGFGVDRDLEKYVSLLRQASSKGHPQAMQSLGFHLVTRSTDLADHKEALKLFEDSAMVVPDSYYGIALIHYQGMTGTVNVNEAVRNLKHGVEHGVGGCMQLLATMYWSGLGIEQDKEKAKELMRGAVERGIPQSDYLLERMEQGYDQLIDADKISEMSNPASGVSQEEVASMVSLARDLLRQGNGVQGIKLLFQAESAGSAEAAMLLGMINMDNFLTASRENKQQDADEYGKLAEQYLLKGFNGDISPRYKTESAQHLGTLYLYRAMPEVELAEEYLKYALQTGGDQNVVMPALRQLAVWHLTGRGNFVNDPSKFVKLSELLIDHGDAHATHALASHYATTQNPDDLQKAIKLSKMAAETFPEAYGMLGQIYFQALELQYSGRSEADETEEERVARFAEAVKWLSLGAEKNDGLSLTLLGVCYDSGVGVEIDKNKSIELVKQALEGGFEEAREVLHRMELLRAPVQPSRETYTQYQRKLQHDYEATAKDDSEFHEVEEEEEEASKDKSEVKKRDWWFKGKDMKQGKEEFHKRDWFYGDK